MGGIANVGLVGTKLTLDELKRIMVSSSYRGYAGGYWPLWGTTTVEPDWSGQNKHGTVTGATRFDHPPRQMGSVDNLQPVFTITSLLSSIVQQYRHMMGYR